MNPTNPINTSNLHVELIDPLTDPRWDRFVEEHPYGWICHLSGWKRFLEDTFSHIRGHYFVLVNESSNNIQAALPVYEVRSWLTGNRLVSIPFATLCDPLVSTSEELDSLIREVLSLYQSKKFSHLEIRALSSPSLFTNNDFVAIKFYKHHFILLDRDPEKLKKTFHRTCVRQRINRALKSELTLRMGKAETDLEEFYKLHLLTRKRRALPPQPYRFFKNLWGTFHSDGKVSLLLAQKDDRILAALILFKFKNRVSVEYAASDESFVKISPNHFLFWEAIKIAYQDGFQIFDFGRTSPTNESLMDFKRRWGTQVIDLPQFIYPKAAAGEIEASEESWKFRLITRICDRAPDSFQRIIGNFCYRHLG
ncbi:MAG: GNAT family N-acetyltransferase [Deltaproteobacteria bacterium]|nr:GNAT family N-acetyltransferase [Deltaproteobacteria bacterium]MBW2024927.1 GNAT family N-acetyltransferase [Deltaproteobacteria bacterium]MBW2124956.1 GNAT family N-acetyltransferase [Deltaproteobacteria bacterium]